MKNSSAYKIIVQHEIIYYSFIGSIKLMDIEEVLIKSSSNSDYSKYFDQVFDFRFCEFSFGIDELSAFVSFIKNEIKIDAVRTDIYLTNRPDEVVITTIFSELIKNFQIKPHIVSTIEKTTQILSRPDLDIIKLKNILDDLKITQPNK